MPQTTGSSTISTGEKISGVSAGESNTPAMGGEKALVICGLSKQHLSHAINFARIVLIIGLVFLHYEKFPNSQTSAFDGMDMHEHQFATWLASSVLFFFFSVVPLLSIISGWLFFAFAPQDAWKTIFRRMKRRFISLYMPLVAWNAFFVLCIYLFYVSHPNDPFLKLFEFSFPLTGIKDYANAIFGITHRPIGFQFWFVRDLFVTALVSPLFWLSIRYTPWLGAGVLCLGWLAHSHMLIFCRGDVPFFFYLGALIRQRDFNVTLALRTAITLTVAYTIWSALRPLAPLIVDNDIRSQRLALDVATSLMRLVGVAGCWGLIYRMAQTNTGRAIGAYGGLAFFLHSAHWPLLEIIKLWVWPLMPGDGDFAMLLNYLVSVSITVFIGIGLGTLLARVFPRFFSLMNGGRLLGQNS